MHEMQPAPRPVAADNVVSDVLASIRRLIAQDGRQLPGRPLHDRPLVQTEDAAPRFVLGQDDLVQPSPCGDGVHLHLVTPDAATDVWQPTPIGDWPAVPVEPLPLELDPAHIDEPDDALTPEEEAEFAEIEAALARMTATPDDATTPQALSAPSAPLPDDPPDDASDPVAPAQSPDPITPNMMAANLFADPAPTTDQALRETVRAMIRAELQGDMGARLSHNVRLMIRHEVENVIHELCAEG